MATVTIISLYSLRNKPLFMKKITILYLCFISISAFSQNFGGCGHIDTASYIQTTVCDNSSDTWINKYRTPSHWIPQNNTPIKTIKVNWIVCLKDDGTGGWQDSQEFRDQVDLMFTHINNWYSNSLPKGYDLTCEPTYTHISDSKIRFELSEIIFLYDSVFHYTTGYGSGHSILSYLHQVYPETKNAMNHFFTMKHPNSPDPGHWGYYADFFDHSYIHTYFSMWSDWLVVWDDHIGHIAHEYGHAVGLHHTYNSEYTNVNHYDFLDDIFGLCQETGYCNPSPPQSHVCYLKEDFFQSFPEHYPIMSGITNSRYISPKSMGRMHRALSLYKNSFRINNKPMHQYIKERTSYHLPLEITSNETWDFSIKMYQDILVKSGNTLTITCEVLMPQNGKIIIEQGAKLIIDGGNITCAYDDALWQGIEVWGNTHLAHTDANQGVLELKNGAIIENATNAVTTWKPNDVAKSGGIIRASNSTFRNNKRSVEFRYYPNCTNTSYFDKCTFTNTGKYNDGTMGSGYMITMENVAGVQFRGCDFEDNNSDAIYFSDLKSGIAASDSYFEVIPFCQGTVYGTCNIEYKESGFTNLNHAIQVEKVSGNQSYKVDRTNFNDCVVGVVNLGVNNSIITRNNFNLGNTQPEEPWSIGIHIQTGTGFTIEENTISRTSSSSSPWGMFGTVVDNAGIDNNFIYKGVFDKMDYASFSTGINSFSLFFTWTGLSYICNDYINSSYNDIFISSSNPPIDGENIKYFQTGASNSAAGNKFSQNGGTYKHIYQDYNNALYYYHGSAAIEIPTLRSSNIFLYQATNNSCPSNFGGGSSGMMAGGNEEEWETQFAENLLAYNTYSIQYQSLLDGGNTQLLKQEVEQTTAQTAFQTAQELTSLSPFVSEDIIKKVIEKEDIINNALLFDILISNPDGLRSEEVQELLNNKQNPLPQWMISLLEDAQGNISAKTLLQIAISTHRTEIDLAVSKLITKQMTKPINANKDSLYMRLDMAPTMLRAINKSDQWIRSGDLSGLQNHLASIENNIDLSENELQSLSDFKDYAILLTQAYQTGLTPYNLDSSYISQFKEIADTYSEPSATLAGNILHNYGFDYYRPPIIKQQNKVQKSSKEGTKTTSHENNFFKIVPNPARGYFALQWKQDDLPKDTYLSVYDLTGKPIFTERIDNQSGQKIVSTQKWQAGTYIVEVSYKKKKVIYSDKVLVVGE